VLQALTSAANALSDIYGVFLTLHFITATAVPLLPAGVAWYHMHVAFDDGYQGFVPDTPLLSALGWVFVMYLSLGRTLDSRQLW
jgi:hypothetical protein